MPGRYKLEELLHEGTSGQLYRAYDTQEDRPVLMKLVSESVSREPEFKRYIHDRWAERENLFEHPNIARVVELGRQKSRYFMAVEDPGGINLQEKLQEAPLETDEALTILHQIAEGLRAAHRRNIIHAHLKPSDIYITRDSANRPLVKLLFLDMGTTAGDSMLTIFGEVHGSPKYMAPEVIRGRSPHPGADIFALGVLGYELLTGREPFESSHAIGYLFANCEATLTPPHEVSEDVPASLSRVIGRCLEREPQNRYQSVQRVVDDLDRCAETLKTGHVSVVPPGTDSAFARSYEVSTDARQKAAAGAGFSAMNVAALVLALAAVAFTVFVNLPALRPNHTPSSGESGAAAAEGSRSAPTETAGAKSGDQQPAEGTGSEDRTVHMRNARMAYEAARDAWDKRYSLQGNYELALAEFKRVSTEYSNTPFAERARQMRAHIHFEWATSLEKEKNYEKAVAHYREALKVAPEGSQYRDDAKKHLPRALARRADYCMQRGLYEDALEIYHRIQEEFPGSMESGLLAKREPQILLNQAVIYWQQQTDLDAALARFQRLIEEYPHSEAAEEARGDLPQLHLDIARERIENGNLEGALEELATLREVFPDSGVGKKATELEADVLYQLFHRARAAGQEAEAHKRFAALTERHPHSKWAQKALRQQLDLVAAEGQVLLNETTALNRLEEAQQALDQMNYETALNKFRAVVRYTSPQSRAGREALDRVPECIYRRGLHELGLGHQEAFREKLQQVQSRFSYSAWADRAAKTLRLSQNVPEGMVFVPEGRFYMGAQKDRIIDFMEPFYPERVMQSEQELSLVLETVGYTSEMPRHIARTDSIYIDRTEVTNEEYKKFLNDTERPPPADWPGNTYREGEGTMPVTGVSYDDAKAYAEWAGKRLPTEAEWEKAARGVDGRFFPWGNVFDRSACRHMRQSGAGPAEVGSYPNGSSPYGVLDLTGNVWEWTSSPFEPYPGHTGRDERAPYSSDYRVLRGGAWPQHDLQPIPTRITFRYPARPDRQSARLGFRCVHDAK